MYLFYLILGLVMIILGAQYLVDGSTAIAKKLRMSQFLIGLTIVGIGTSMPELVVSVIGAIQGKGDIAIGNVTGSNLANILFILGLTALIKPVSITRSTLRFDIPFNIFASVLLLFFAFGFNFWKSTATGVITRWEGLIFLALFVFFMVYSFVTGKKDGADAEQENESDKKKKKIPVWLMVIMIVGGLAALVTGGNLFVRGATHLAQALGVSQAVISITVLALGTSLPELATSIVATIKGNTQLALGNIIGSNLFNIFLILGVSSVISPLETGTVAPMDMYVNILASLLLLASAFTFKKNKLDKGEGIMFLLVYVAYIYLLVSR